MYRILCNYTLCLFACFFFSSETLSQKHALLTLWFSFLVLLYAWNCSTQHKLRLSSVF